MQAGKLRHRLTLQMKTVTQDKTTGRLTETWQDVCKIWGNIAPLSAREFLASQSIQSEITTRITIRYKKNIDSTMRLLHGGKIYNIEGALADAKSGIEYLTLPCSEGVNNG
jgi:SPP1 family predicted phage head-tail adaptor